MDALALLCNLYGDGPATLKRLRSAGCDSFSALDDLEPDQLAEILGTNEAAARRFLREARLLVERVADGQLEIEERPPLATASGGPAPALPKRPAGSSEPARAEPALSGAPSPAAPFTSSPASASPGSRGAQALARPEDGEASEGASDAGSTEPPAGGDRTVELIDRVLATWRERDAVLGDGAGFGDRSEEPAREAALDDEPSAQASPKGAGAPGTPLRARLVDGLDRGLVDRLRASGLSTLEAVADGDAMAIAQSSSTELTKILRLQFLARRLIGERGAGESPESSGVLQPAGRPWPLSRGVDPAKTLPRPEPGVRGSAAPGGAGPEADPAQPKFSLSETPLEAAGSGLSDELDRASRRLRRSDADSASPEEGTGGPFA